MDPSFQKISCNAEPKMRPASHLSRTSSKRRGVKNLSKRFWQHQIPGFSAFSCFSGFKLDFKRQKRKQIEALAAIKVYDLSKCFSLSFQTVLSKTHKCCFLEQVRNISIDLISYHCLSEDTWGAKQLINIKIHKYILELKYKLQVMCGKIISNLCFHFSFQREIDEAEVLGTRNNRSWENLPHGQT